MCENTTYFCRTAFSMHATCICLPARLPLVRPPCLLLRLLMCLLCVCCFPFFVVQGSDRGSGLVPKSCLQKFREVSRCVHLGLLYRLQCPRPSRTVPRTRNIQNIFNKNINNPLTPIGSCRDLHLRKLTGIDRTIQLSSD